jgi:hypothetical protein
MVTTIVEVKMAMTATVKDDDDDGAAGMHDGDDGLKRMHDGDGGGGGDG